MPTELILPTSMTFALTAWSLIFFLYVHPALRAYPLARAIEPILFLHTFRYIGLMFLLPGVTNEVLDSRFSIPAAHGDLVAAFLAFVAIGASRLNAPWALASVWIFNIWGMADLVNAVTRGIMHTADGDLGAAYWIPATIVPLLLVSHVYVFVLLIRHRRGRGRPVSD